MQGLAPLQHLQTGSLNINIGSLNEIIGSLNENIGNTICVGTYSSVGVLDRPQVRRNRRFVTAGRASFKTHKRNNTWCGCIQDAVEGGDRKSDSRFGTQLEVVLQLQDVKLVVVE